MTIAPFDFNKINKSRSINYETMKYFLRSRNIGQRFAQRVNLGAAPKHIGRDTNERPLRQPRAMVG